MELHIRHTVRCMPERAKVRRFSLSTYKERTKSLAQFKAWKDACADLDESSGLAALQAEQERAAERLDRAERDIIDMPTTTFAGIAVKLACCVRDDAMDSANDEEWPENRAPVLALASAWKTALALAGLPEDLGLEEHKKFLAEKAEESEDA